MIGHLRGEQDHLDPGERALFSPILKRLQRERTSRRRSLMTAMKSSRYTDLLDRLEDAARRPRSRSAHPSPDEVAAASFAKLRKAVRKLDRSPTDNALHKVRIKGKRARYAAELAAPGHGKKAAKFIDAAKKFQDVTGEHQDAVVTVERLRELSAKGDTGTAFAAGRLAERQEESRQQARGAFAGAWRSLEQAGKRAW